jgi:hypothetical protein
MDHVGALAQRSQHPLDDRREQPLGGRRSTGQAAAAAMIADADARRPLRRVPVRGRLGAGVWRPVPPALAHDPNAWLKDVTPFLIENPAQFRSKGRSC